MSYHPRKPKFVCFTCRKMFRIRIDVFRLRWDQKLKAAIPDLERRDHPPICPECGSPMREVNRDFRPPRRDDKQAWEAAELLQITGHSWAAKAQAGSRQRIARAGQAKRYIKANPLSQSDMHLKSEGERLLAKYRKRTGK